ncbi:MAG: hypothetical protein ACR2LK_02715 [Solirubrobacteraceae bacterium]
MSTRDGERLAEGDVLLGAPVAAAADVTCGRPLGIDIEAWPFVALATLVSLSLAFGAWLRPQFAALLTLTAVIMLAFTALDVREVVHQVDVNEDGLAALAAGIALLHGGAAAVAAAMTRGLRRPGTRSPAAGKMLA